MSTWPTDPRTYAAVFAASPNGIIVLDPSDRVVAINGGVLTLAGFEETDFVGHLAGEVFSPDVCRFINEARLAGTQAHQREVRANAKDASEIAVEMTSVPISDGHDAGALFLLIHDVRRRREAENRFRSLFEHNPAMAIEMNATGFITDVNPAGLAVTGYPRDLIVSRHVRDLIRRDSQQTALENLNAALDGQYVTFEVDGHRANGENILYKAMFMPRYTHGRLSGAYGLLEDVTLRSHAERTIAAQAEELSDRTRLFRSLFQHNPDGVVSVNRDGVIQDVNDASLRIGGYHRDVVIGRSFAEFLHPPERERVQRLFERALEGEPVSFEAEAPRMDGSIAALDVTVIPAVWGNEVIGTYSVLQDITPRKEAERRAEMQSQRIRELYLVAATPSYSETQIVTTLQMGCKMFGADCAVIVDCTGQPHIDVRHDLMTPGDDTDEILRVAPFIAGGSDVYILNANDPTCNLYHSGIGTKLVVGGQDFGALIFLGRARRTPPYDDTDCDLMALIAALLSGALDRRRTRSHLRTLAYYDSLTGLPNRVFFQERVRDALEEAQEIGGRVAVLFFDLDRFKDINDTLGHGLGDRLLQLVAERLVQVVGLRGTVARMGGDEFIVLLPNCDRNEELRATAEALLHAVDDPYHLDEYEQYITTSIGIAVYPDDGRDDQTLIKNADIAMYRAKDRGRNGYYFYSAALEAPIRTRLSQEKLLRRALEESQFALHYQPIIDVCSGAILAAEALVRWNHPYTGLILPDQFIPSAEASGLIVPLGEWVLATAAAQVREWADESGRLALAVNLSARQFHYPDLCARMVRIIMHSGLDTADVEIEITESVAMADASLAIRTVRELKRAGVCVAVDDFGTGHSALSYLRRFDVDIMKIDRSFVDGIGSEASDETIVKTLIAMGHSLGLTVVAEGVETPAQFEFLREHGCDRLQGYYISPPVDPQRFRELLLERRSTLTQPG